MKKEILKLGLIILGLIIGIIIFSGKPVIKSFKQDTNPSYQLTSRDSKLLENAMTLQEAGIKVIEQIRPAVVNISTVYTYEIPQIEFYFGDPFEEFFNDFFGFEMPRQRQPKQRRKQQYRTEGGGSGVIISEDGYILTNEHVIKGASEIKVLVSKNGEDKEYKGKVVGKDPKTDLAVVKINAKNLSYAKLGDSDKIRVGEWVIAIGSPFGLEQTVTQGIVSALRQRIFVEGREYRDFIQTDAAINRGNSGGPLCNLNGEVIGINTAIYAPTGVFAGIGFAIPINRAKDILDDLIHKGKVTRGWLGVEIRPVDDVIAKQFGLKTKSGVLVNNVVKNTPAEKSGIKRGDIILEIRTAKKEMKINSPQELQDIISSLAPKEKIWLKIFREKKEQIIEVILGEMPQDTSKLEPSEEEQKEEKFVWLGYEFVNLDDRYRDKMNLDEEIKGVIVSNIDYRAKDYEDIGLKEFDVVVSVNQTEVKNVSVLKKVVKSVDIKDGVVFDVIRDGKPVFISFSK